MFLSEFSVYFNKNQTKKARTGFWKVAFSEKNLRKKKIIMSFVENVYVKIFNKWYKKYVQWYHPAMYCLLELSVAHILKENLSWEYVIL